MVELLHVPAGANGLEVLLHPPVVLDLRRDGDGNSLTARESNRPGPG